MNGTTYRTARTPHLCEWCNRSSRHTDLPPVTIPVGHRYVRHVVFPGTSGWEVDQPAAVAECVACFATRTGDDPLTVGACGTFCCVPTPCARPARHDGGHSCGRCPTGD